MPVSKTQFNTKQYSWAEVDIQLGARLLTGVRGVTYDSEQEKELLFAKGSEPQSIQRGNKTYSGELTVLQNELELLIASAPNSDLRDYRNLTMIISYKDEDGKLITDSLTGVEFTKTTKAIKQNDKFMEVPLPILFLKVNYNI